MTCKEAYRKATDILQNVGIEEAAVDTMLLLERFCGLTRSDVLAFGEREIPEEQFCSFMTAIERRKLRIPLQLITGVQEFMGLDFLVSGKVLIPRIDTEFITEEVLKWLSDGMKILDLCTGSGCILISLLHYSNDCKGVGMDISPDALDLASTNADRLLKSGDKVSWVCCDLFQEWDEALAESVTNIADTSINSDRYLKFDRIVSNPPYIPTAAITELMPEVCLHEPHTALDGGADGLDFYRRITTTAGRYLEQEGMLFLEIGHDQGESVRRLLIEGYYQDVEILKDYSGCDRVAMGIWRSKSDMVT
jgi:release factor glutamine methyltransferase